MLNRPTVKDLLAVLNTMHPDLPVVIDGAYLGEIAHLVGVCENVGVSPETDGKPVCVLELQCIGGAGQSMGPKEMAAYLSRFF